MSHNFIRLSDGMAAISPAKTVEFHSTGIAGLEELVVSESINSEDLRRVLDCVVQEDCVHSWRNFGREGTVDDLLRWENERRPTKLFFFYLKRGDEMRMVAASAVAERLTRGFPHSGFCVLGRCYIMPQFRGRDLYRRILRYRLEYCRAQFGNGLNAIHIGSVNERISQVITNHGLDGWPRFIHLGEEELGVGKQVRTVDAYMLLIPEYVQKIKYALMGAQAPRCIVELRNTLSRIEAGDIRNLGVLVKQTFEEARACGWFDERNSHEIEQLMLFCKSIPLLGYR